MARVTLSQWLDERTGWRAAVRAWNERRAALDASPAPLAALALAAGVATCVLVLVLTGLVLMTAYAPSPQSAWASVHYVQYVQEKGWIVRGLHHWAAQTLLGLSVLHVVHGALSASYRKPRELVWW